MAGDELRQRFETLEAEVLPLADSPALDAIRRRGRRRQRTVRATVLVPAVLVGVLVAQGVEDARPRLWVGPVAPVPTTQPAPAPPTTAAPPPSAVPRPPSSARPRPTTAPSTTAAAARLELRADGLGVVGFGTGEREALDRLKRRLGAPDERGAWSGATPFGACPGPVRAVRWGRLYVLFTNGPTRYEAGGRWHLFAYQVDAVRRTATDPDYNGPRRRPIPRRCGGPAPGPLPASASAPPWPSCAASMAGACRPPSANPEWHTGSGSTSAPPGSCPAPSAAAPPARPSPSSPPARSAASRPRDRRLLACREPDATW